MTSDGLILRLIETLCVLCFFGCARQYAVVSEDFDVCSKLTDGIVYQLQEGVDFDQGTITLNGHVMDIYVGRQPDLNGIPEFHFTKSREIRKLYSGGSNNSGTLLAAYGYNDSKSDDIHEVFVMISGSTDGTTRDAITTFGASLTRCH